MILTIERNNTFHMFLLSVLIFFIRVIAHQNILVSKLITVFMLFVAAFLTCLGRKEYTIIPLYSVLEFDAEVSPQNQAFEALLILVFLDLLLRLWKKDFIKVNFITFVFGFFSIVYTLFGLVNVYIDSNAKDYFLFDFKIYLSVFLSAVFFSNLNFKKLLNVIHVLLFSYLLFVLYGYLFSLPSIKLETREFVGYSSQLTLLLSVVTALFVFRFSFFYGILLSFLFFLMVITDNVISQNILAVLVSSFIGVVAAKKKALKLIGVIILLLSIFLTLSISSNSLRSEEKINNISSIFNGASLYHINHSPLIRIIEFSNIVNDITFNSKFIGAGFGGYMSDDFINFPKLTKFDFSEEQIVLRKYYIPHNFNYPLLKFGLLYLLFVIYTLKKINQMDVNKKLILTIFFMFACLNLGFTFLPSIMLGVVIGNLSKKNSYN